MKRRILSFVLILAMVLSFVPAYAVAAEEAVTASPKAGTHTNAAHKCEECDSTAWKAWTSGGTLPTEGHYVLMNDITLTGEITMTGDLHICLNGYVITGKGDRRLIGTKANADTTLVITDCTAYTEDEVYHAGALTGGVDTSTGGGGAIFVRRGGSCKIYEGRITGNMHKNDSAGGGAVLLQAKNDSYAGGKLYMYGGEITNNKAFKADGKTVVYGGAIYANTGTTVELEGVTISGNTGTYGGAIYANTSSTVKITDSTIKGNTGTRGGAIYGSAATIQLKDTTLEDNNGGSGTVGLYSRSTLTTDNVTFTGNTTTNGSAVCAEGSSTVTLKDTTITGNTATSTTGGRSAAIYVVSATVKFSGKTVITGNTTQGANIPDVVLDNASYDTLQIHELTEGSRVVFATPNTEPVEAKEVIVLDTTQTAPWQLGWVRYMTAGGGLKDIGLAGNEFVFGTYHYHGDQVYTPLTDASQLEAGGYYYLTENVTLDKLANLQAKDLNLEICLNGHDLKPAEGEQVLYIGGTRNITVTIDDCTAYTDANGVYHAGAITGADHTSNGGAIYLGSTDTLHLKNGKISGNKGGHGGAVIVFGTFRISGGELSDNTASKSGGAIYVNKNTVGGLIMTGGTIRDNSANSGGAVFVGVNTAVELGDVTITGNTAAAGGGAFTVNDNVTVKLTGTPKITGNTVAGVTSNLRLGGSTMLQVEDLTDKASVGISLSDRTTGTLHFAENVTKDYSSCFVSDDTAYVVGYEDNKLLLEKAFEHIHCVCGEAGCTEHTQVTYLPWNDATSLPTSGSYCLLTDVTVEKTVDLTENVDLCLHGHTITQKAGSNAQMYKTQADAGVKLTISDCTAKTENGTYTAGSITGFVGNAEGPVMYLRLGTTLELFDGIFENNNAEGGSGGAILINGEFKMYGGQFVGNRAGTADNGKNGGALYLNKDSVATITGGAFLNNSAKNGGAIYSMGHITVKDTVFTGNTADEGGALFLRSSSTAPNTRNAVLENVTVTGNTTKDTGAVYLLSSLGSLRLQGNVQITGNTGKNLYLPEDYVFSAADIAAGAKVGVSASDPGRAITTDCADYTENFISDDADYVVKHREGKLWLVSSFQHIHCVCGEAGCTEHTQVSYLPWNDPTSLPTSGSYCLLTDVTVEKTVNLTENVDLCLHGHTITQKPGTYAQMYNTKADAGVKLTISDCTAKTENGTYTAGSIADFVGNAEGSVMNLRLGTTLELHDGIFENNQTADSSAGVMIINGQLHMYGGQFIGNRAGTVGSGKNGGAIYLNRDAVATITGGAFLNNSAAAGGAIYSMGHITVKDTVFTGNTADEGGALFLRSSSAAPNTSNAVLENVTVTGNTTKETGAVYLLSSLGSLRLQGNVQIYGNTGKNLYLPKDYVFSAADIAADAKVGVTAQEMGKAISGPCADYTANFISDNTKFLIVYKENALYLDAAGDHKHCFCAGESTHCDHEVLTFAEWDDPTSLPTSGNYYLSVDVELPSQISLDSATLNLCLNGHTVKLKTRMFYPRGETTLRILDCTNAPGKITGGTKSAILVDKNSTVTIELWNGIFTGNEGESVGGAILLQGNTTFRMYGGKITGNALISRLKTDENGNVLLDANGAQTYTSARGGGGVGVYGENTSFYMYGGEISGNKARSVTYLDKNGEKDEAGGDGGGIYVYKGSVYLYGGTVSGNYAQQHAGGIFSSYGNVVIDGGTVSGNSTDGGAGGIYASTGSTMLLKSGLISKNKAKSSGGGIVAQGKGTVFTYTGGTVSNNQSEGSAAGILVQSRAEMTMTGGTVKGNRSNGNGGGIYISTKSVLKMTGGTVTGNIAKSQGGGMYLNKATSTISGAYIGSNTSLNNTAGGIRMAGGTLTISGCQIVGNHAKTSGCGLVVGGSSNTENGVKVNYYATAYIYGCSFRDNVTEGSAGGLLLQSVGTVATVSGCTFTNNTAKGSGGGMYVSRNVTATIKNSKFLNNEAAAGGGFRLNYCEVAMEDITVGDNVGGGAYVYGLGCEAQLKDFEIYGNSVGSGAGILFNSGAVATFENARIYENTAKNTAGGVYIGSRSQVVVKDLDIHNNQATNAGGFYCGAGSVVVAENLNIYENSAAALGGGIYSGADLTVKNSVIRNNTAAENGGGVHTWKSSSRWTADDACTRLIGCQIFGNSASGQGGGVFVHRGGPLQLTGVTVESNSAALEGGGIYCDGRMDLTDVEVRKNTSGGEGFAVYLTPAEYDGRSYFSGYKNIAGNTVIEDNEKGDMYLAEGIAVAISGATLGDDARIHVTLSDGVLTQRVVGVYHYEGEGLTYVLTAGDRSVTEPMVAEDPQQADSQTQQAEADTWLYVLVGVVAVLLVAAVLYVLLRKKKNSAKTGKEV